MALGADGRTMEQLREHYRIETELAERLRGASPPERRQLYSALYDELFRRVPLHPQLTRKSSAQETDVAVGMQLRFLAPFLNPDAAFLEVGPGDCALSLAMAARVRQVYAVDVSDEITRGLAAPQNFRLVLSDGSSVPVPAGSIDVAYSNQLIEHLHPDDAFEQLKNIHAALAPGGVYACVTPNRLNGPHDISMYFADVASGFHLKEYTMRELTELFSKAGFSRIRAYVGARGNYLALPVAPLVWFERLLERLPAAVRRFVARSAPARLLLGIRLVGIK